MTTQYGFYIDTTRCTGCKTCQVSCKDKNDLGKGVRWRRVYEYAGGNWTELADGTFEQSVFSYYVPISCNHCSHPVCVKACPTGACNKRKEDGLVVIDEEICIGCQSCARACPYDAPQFDYDRGVMTKCDGCYDRMKEGKLPTCVESCPLRALDFGPMEELKKRYPEAREGDIQPIPSASITHPNLLIKANRNESGGAKLNNQVEV